jgi:hypothetical protein
MGFLWEPQIGITYSYTYSKYVKTYSKYVKTYSNICSVIGGHVRRRRRRRGR